MNGPPENVGAEIVVRADAVVLERGGRRVLDHVSLVLHRGDRVVLTGPNGAGKSTLIRVLAGLETLRGGTVSRPARCLGVVFEQGGLISGLTVAENLALPLVRARVAETRLRDRVGWALARFDLAAWERSPVEELTRGIAVRVQIARAALLAPDLLLCDAPLDALDANSAAELERMILRLAQTGGAAVLMATNSPERARLFAGRSWRIDQGRLSVAPAAQG